MEHLHISSHTYIKQDIIAINNNYQQMKQFWLSNKNLLTKTLLSIQFVYMYIFQPMAFFIYIYM